MKTYLEFHIRTNPFLPELITGLLWELDILGLEEEESFIKVFAGENNLTKEEIEDSVSKLVNEELIAEYSVQEYKLQNKNWNEEWEKNLNIIKITDRIVIKPSSKNYTPKLNEIVLKIDPKMSFGTGEHQTTKLMLKLIEKYLRPGMKILDVGSGTAILAIASIKLGAVSAFAIDSDELCFDNGNENCRLNDVEENITVKTGEIKDLNKKNFDIIAANIQKNILLNIADEIKSRLRKKGLTILSGLLEDDEEEIIEHYNKIDFVFVGKEKMDEWIALVFKLK